MKRKRILTIGIDASFTCTGIAVIRSKGKVDTLIDTCVITGNTKLEWQAAAYRVSKTCVKAIDLRVNRYRDMGYEIRIVIEMPFTWSASRGIGAKIGGSLQKLFFLVGCLYIEFGGQCALVPPHKWKGNAPKKVTYSRMKSKYGFRFTPTERNYNVSDAVGIADHGLNRLKPTDFVPPQFGHVVSHVG